MFEVPSRFPRRGERTIISGIEVEFLLNRSEIPASWLEVAEVVRGRTGEPRERRVLANLLGTMLAMVENKLDSLGQGLSLLHSQSQPVQSSRGQRSR